jgi:preprotein translocase subunit SecY
VAQSIWWESLAPIGPMSDGKLYGSFIALGQSILKGEGLWSILHRSGGLPDMIGFITTIVIFLVVIYLEGVRLELPLAYAQYRGYRSRFPVKFLYVSNIPVILASALFANIYFFSELIWYNFNKNNDNFWLNLIGTFNATSSTSSSVQPTGGLAFYTTAPRDISILVTNPLKAIIFVAILVGLSVLFALTWLQVGGLDSRTVAKQLMDAGMQIPGFRRSEQQIKTILDRYIPAVTVLGGAAVGAIAALGDLTNAFGSGTGILLLVGILYQYYQSLAKERMAEVHPAIRQFLGE